MTLIFAKFDADLINISKVAWFFGLPSIQIIQLHVEKHCCEVKSMSRTNTGTMYRPNVSAVQARYSV